MDNNVTRICGVVIATVALLCSAIPDTTENGNSYEQGLCELAVVSDVMSPYLVLDLSGGAEATNYPISWLESVPKDGWTDEFKTTKLVLRRICKGSFTMGSPSNEIGRAGAYGNLGDNYENQRTVKIEKPFYLGIFEITQRQYELVTGTLPSFFTNAQYYATRPVERVSYKEIVGATNSKNLVETNAISSSSFIGRIRLCTGLAGFDLPTEAEWEYACRAGTTNALNSGNDLLHIGHDTYMDEVGRYWYNGGSNFSSRCNSDFGTAQVGSYVPNAWGLYDMHGNVWEWCRNERASSSLTILDSSPPLGLNNSNRPIRGGSWRNGSQGCRSSYHLAHPMEYGGYHLGFRLALVGQ